MKTVEVAIKQSASAVVEIEAESAEQAEEIAQENYELGVEYLKPEDYETDFQTLREMKLTRRCGETVETEPSDKCPDLGLHEFIEEL